ncbi:MAG: DUF1499 domain-containing protein [Gemmataceae bacterium]|nr:DUF1499 domain-containing protein [Gemmataceae bacterium]
MGWLRWFTRNWADTAGPSHPDLAPLVLPLPPDAAAERVRAVVRSLPRWREESAAADELKLTRRTGLFRFVDDITLTFRPAGAGTLIHAASRSRLGKGDLGQNRRNILELWAAIREFRV